MHTFHLSPKRITRFLIWVSVGLSIASFAGNFAWYVLGTTVKDLTLRLDVGSDTSLPTWFASFILFLCFLLLGFITGIKKQKGDRFFVHWFTLALLFLYISVDEVATFRETIGRAVRDSVPTDGIFYYNWVIVGIPFVIVFALAYIKFLAHLPKQIRRLFVMAGSLYVLGALGCEMVASLIHSSYGAQNLLYAFVTTIEEFLEMVGVVLFLQALMSYLSLQQIDQVKICVDADRMQGLESERSHSI